MHLVALFQTAQYRNGILHGRFTDVNLLESSLQCRIFLDALAVFVQRGRADATQLAARQRGFEHIRGVHGAFRGAGADQGMQLVDKQHNPAAGFGDFFQDGFQSVFELAAELCAGDQRAEIEGDQPLFFQSLGHIAVDDAQRQAFDDGGFADPGLADQHRIVLGPARQHLDHPANFIVAPDHRIEFSFARQDRSSRGRIFPAPGIFLRDWDR